MKKKIGSLILAMIMCMSLCTSTFAINMTPQNTAIARQIAEENSQAQYQELMTEFGFDGNVEDITYPEYYGGAYINEDGILVVTQTVAAKSGLNSLLSGTYTIDTVKYSYNELSNLKKGIDDKCNTLRGDLSNCSEKEETLLNSITSFYISQKNNSVVVGITELSKDKIEDFYSVFGKSSAIEFVEGNQNTTTTSLHPGGPLTSPAGSLSIGWPAYFYDDNGNVCRGFVSAGHAFSAGDSVTVNGVAVGTCVASAFYGRNDAALIKITDPNYSVSNTVAVSGITLSNTRYMLVSEGSTIYKVGSNSGLRSGTVTSTDGTVRYTINGEQVTISNVLVTNAINLGGDSGGIVYCRSGNAYYAIGTASGSKYSGAYLTESSFIECYVSQMLNALQVLDCSYLPLT